MNATFRIVNLTYNPDFKEKYFYKYYDIEKYQDPPSDDSLFEYTSAVGLFSDPDIVFIPIPSPSPVCTGPPTPTKINLVIVGLVDPNAKSTRYFLGPPRSRITRAQYFKKKL